MGGLAAACVAAARGHKVTLYDKNAWIGGKAAVLHEDGFRFDMGPTILTVPRVLERIFAEAGRDMHAYLDLVRLDPQWRRFGRLAAVLRRHRFGPRPQPHGAAAVAEEVCEVGGKAEGVACGAIAVPSALVDERGGVGDRPGFAAAVDGA